MEHVFLLKIFSLLIGFYMAWNIGVNDVSNAMATAIGSKAITIVKAIIIASILEFCGAFFLGAHVSQTIQGGIIKPEIFHHDAMLYVLGMVGALCSTAIWLNIASFFKLPVSTTHAIVGAVVGFGAVIGGMHAVYWLNFFMILFSWIAAPVFSGIIAFIFFRFFQKHILFSLNPIDATKKLFPVLIFFISFLLSLNFLSSSFLEKYLALPWIIIFILSIFIGLSCSFFTHFLVRSIKSPIETSLPAHFPSHYTSLEKAKKHLERTALSTTGKMKEKSARLLQETKDLLSSMQQEKEYSHYTSSYQKVEKMFGYLQLFSICLIAFAHGANDVANAIGPIAGIMVTLKNNAIPAFAEIPHWLLFLGGFGIVLGLVSWGWRIIETIGKKITELTPTRGFSAELSASLIILSASKLGVPISTTQALVGAVLGVGFAHGLQALNLQIIRDILFSWAITIPVSAFLSISTFYLLKIFFY